MKTHVVLMFLYAASTAAFFALLWRETRRDRIRLFALIFSSLFAGAILAGWVMYGFPRSRNPERSDGSRERSRDVRPSRDAAGIVAWPRVEGLASRAGSSDPSLRSGLDQS